MPLREYRSRTGSLTLAFRDDKGEAGRPDPARATGAEAEIALSFADVYRMLSNRILVFTTRPIESLDRLSLQRELTRIGAMERRTGGRERRLSHSPLRGGASPTSSSSGDAKRRPKDLGESHCRPGLILRFLVASFGLT